MARRIFIDASGMRISKAGRDALSCDPEDLLVDTTRRNTRAYMSGRIQGTGAYAYSPTPGYAAYDVVAYHGMGYMPLCNAVHVGSGSLDIIVDTGRIVARFYQIYGSGGSPASTATLPGYVDYSLFYDQWF